MAITTGCNIINSRATEVIRILLKFSPMLCVSFSPNVLGWTVHLAGGTMTGTEVEAR